MCFDTIEAVMREFELFHFFFSYLVCKFFFHLVQQPKTIYLANQVSPDKGFFSMDYISFGCI